MLSKNQKIFDSDTILFSLEVILFDKSQNLYLVQS